MKPYESYLKKPYAQERIAALRESGVVIKISGNTVERPEAFANIASQISVLTRLGIRTTLIHGAGPQLNALFGEKKLDSTGRRITPPDAEILRKAMMITRSTSRKVLEMLAKALPEGKSPQYLPPLFLTATPFSKENASGIPKHLWLPPSMRKQVSPLVMGHFGVSEEGSPVNINADEVAAKVAEVIGAEKLFLFGGTNGILDTEKRTIPTVAGFEALNALEGIATEGMKIKAKTAADAARKGIDTHILPDNPAYGDILLQELFLPRGVPHRATMITAFPSTPFQLKPWEHHSIKVLNPKDISEERLAAFLATHADILRPRDLEYIRKHKARFLLLAQGEKIVASGEIIPHNDTFWELGALIGKNGFGEGILELFDEKRAKAGIPYGCAVVPITNKTSLRFFGRFALQAPFPHWFPKNRKQHNRIFFQW